MNRKSHTVNVDNFRDMLKICPKLPGQKFEDPLFKKEILSFIRDLGHTGEIKVLSDVNVNHLHQPWRSFATIINKCLSGKTTALESLCLSRAQILWGIYHNKNVDYVYLLWEDLVYQVENKNSKKKNDMYYPRFTKVIVDYFMAKDQAILRRNKMFWHYAKDDIMFTTIRVISKHQDTQVYGSILPQHLTNQDMLESESYKTYHAYATGEKTPKLKSIKKKSDFESSPKTKPTQASKGKRIKTSAKGVILAKKKQSATKSKGLMVLSEVALTEAEQMNIALERRKTQQHSSHASGSGFSDEEDDDEVNMGDDNDDDVDNQDDDEQDDVNEQTDSNNNNDDFVHPKLSTHDEEDKEEEDSDSRIHTPSNYESTDDEEINPEAQQQSSSMSSGFISNMINPSLDTGIDFIFNLNTKSTSLIDVPVTTIVELPLLSTTTLPPPPTPLITHLKQTNLMQQFLQFPALLMAYLANKMHEAVKIAVQLQSNRLKDEAQAENADFINKLNDNIKKIIKDQVKEQVKAQVSKILSKIEKTINEKLEAEVLTRSSNVSKTSHVVADNLSELELKKMIIDKMESNKLIYRSDEQKNLYKEDKEDKDQEPSTGSNRGSKRRRAGKETESTSASKEKTSKTTGKSTEGSKSHQKSVDKSAQAEEPMQTTKYLEEPVHQEFKIGVTEDQPDEETSQLPDWFQKLAKPPTLDRDWNKTLSNAHGLNNPEGQQYPHDLRKPLPLIPNSRGRHVIPFNHFINNDLAYLSGGVSSRTYTTSVTKTKAADYGHIKWIEDLVSNTMWSQVPVSYDKHALWGISHWGRKRQQFYGFATKQRNYWITVHRDDDKLYTFKEGDFNRLRILDIEDVLLLLVQGKLTNLTIEECLAFNVSLRISDLKQREAFTAYSNPRGFIYQNKDKKNRLMRIDELHKFSDGTLNDVRTALDDRLKGIRMKYLPQTIWRQSNRDKA
ncbi:hypothetical protein Tco_0468352 [Tanacetum coccineum]